MLKKNFKVQGGSYRNSMGGSYRNSMGGGPILGFRTSRTSTTQVSTCLCVRTYS